MLSSSPARKIFSTTSASLPKTPDLAPPAPMLNLTPAERTVRESIGDDETPIDEIISKCGLPTHEVSSPCSPLRCGSWSSNFRQPLRENSITCQRLSSLRKSPASQLTWPALLARSQEERLFESHEFVITSALGHLVELCLPGEMDKKRGKWSLRTCPFSRSFRPQAYREDASSLQFDQAIAQTI